MKPGEFEIFIRLLCEAVVHGPGVDAEGMIQLAWCAKSAQDAIDTVEEIENGKAEAGPLPN